VNNFISKAIKKRGDRQIKIQKEDPRITREKYLKIIYYLIKALELIFSIPFWILWNWVLWSK